MTKTPCTLFPCSRWCTLQTTDLPPASQHLSRHQTDVLSSEGPGTDPASRTTLPQMAKDCCLPATPGAAGELTKASSYLCLRFSPQLSAIHLLGKLSGPRRVQLIKVSSLGYQEIIARKTIAYVGECIPKAIIK